LDFLLWLEDAFRWVQEAESIFAYPMILTFHTFGMAFLVGTSVAIDLRILGVARGLPLAPMEKFYPVMIIAFWTNVVSGALLFAPEATRWTFNPDFLLKMAFVFLGVLMIRLIQTSVFRGTAGPDAASRSTKGKVLAATSIAVWLAAITAGRLTAYVDSWSKFMSLFVVTEH
jgi:hypothetical protein